MQPTRVHCDCVYILNEHHTVKLYCYHKTPQCTRVWYTVVSRPGISVCPCPPGYCPSVFTRVVSHLGSAPVSHQGTAPVSHPHLHSAHYLLHSSHSLHRSGGHHHKANRGDDRQTLTQKSSTKSATIRANKSYDRISPTKKITCILN